MGLTNRPVYILMEFLREEAGAPFIEYALIASLVALVLGLFLMALNKKY